MNARKKLKTAFCILKSKYPSDCESVMHFSHHVGAAIIDLEDKKAEPFIIEVWDTPLVGRAFREGKMAGRRRFIEEGLKEKDLTKAATWQGLNSDVMEVIPLFSEKSFTDFKKDYIKKYGDPAISGDFFDENFGSCCCGFCPSGGLCNNCSTPVLYSLSDLVPKNYFFEAGHFFLRVLSTPFVIATCGGHCGCLQTPPLIDSPLTAMTKARFYSDAHGVKLLFAQPTAQTPLLSGLEEEYKVPSPARQAMS